MPITRRMLDQTQILADRVTETLTNDLPRDLDWTIINGNGTDPEPMGLLKLLEDATGALAATSFGSGGFAAGNKGGAPLYERVNKLLTQLKERNVAKRGTAVYLTTPSIAGRLTEIPTVQRSTTSDIAVAGNMILNGTTMMAQNGAMVVENNNIEARYAGQKTRSSSGTLHPLLAVIPALIKLAYFGDMTLLVDPYTEKGTGIIELQPRWPVHFNFLHNELVSGALDVRDDVVDA